MLSKKLLSSLTTLLFLSGQIYAEEPATENAEPSIEGHVSVGSSRKDHDQLDRRQQQPKSENPSEEAPDQAEGQEIFQKANNVLSSAQNEFMFAPRIMTPPQFQRTAYSAFPVNCHWLTSIADTYHSIELEDGSHWDICPVDTYVMRNWRREDSIVITPNNSWLTSYNYYLSNKTRNNYVRADLRVGPLAFGSFSHWIVNIDYLGGHVYLENQMVWCVDPQDNHILRTWAVNHHIILGVYESWFSYYDHILINVDMDEYIHVRQY